jgi:hypothetical protein
LDVPPTRLELFDEWRPATAATVIFAALHVPFGMALLYVPALALVHGLLTVAVAVAWAIQGRPLDRVACAAAYIVGAEVLWRMARVPLFWEFGKYAVGGVLLIAAVRAARAHAPLLSSLYFLLLIPSAALTVLNDSPGDARAYISFNLSGPFALAAAAWFFAQITLTTARLRRILLSAVIPLLSISTLTLFSILTAGSIVFTTESNLATSGGFGPNQVSASLGLGALIAVATAASAGTPAVLRMGLLMLGVVFAGQSMLTFSRGGIYNAAAAGAVAFVFLLQDARSRLAVALVSVAILVALPLVVMPRLDAFTGGALSARFASFDLTNRGELAQLDVKIWQDNTLLGVGPGQAGYYRERAGRYAAAHTEYTRMLAEHGMFGLVSILLLIAAVIHNIRATPDVRVRALLAGLAAWALIYMLDKAMRTAAPAFMLGLTFGGGYVAQQLVQRTAVPIRRVMQTAHATRRFVGADR